MNSQAPTRTLRLLPPRLGDTDDERRLREAINRLGTQLLATLDSAINLRTAPADAQKARHVARGHLQDFALHAALSLAHCQVDRES